MEDRYIGKMLDGRYEILSVLGVGGMAVVYKAKCHRLNRMVAVKILKPELAEDDEIRRRFHDESQAVGMMSHPNIVNVYDVSQSEGVEYMVMELIEGITLKQYMSRRGGTLNWREGLHFMNQILQALKHAHSKGIIHRDIKPQNIMVLRDGSVKVADFGIARIKDSQHTMTQEALGSVHYISPEQAKGSEIDGRSDIYSAGVVLYEMLTGRLPFQGESPVAVALQHINCVPQPPRELNAEIPTGMEQIIMKAMAPDRELRYLDADDMLADLEAFRKNPAMLFPYEDLWTLSGLNVAIQNTVAAGETEDEPTKKVNVAAAPQPVQPPQNEPENDGEDEDEEDEEEEDTSRRTMLIIGGVVAAILIVIALIFRMVWPFFSDLLQPGAVYQVPELRGMTRAEAQEMIFNNHDLSGHFTITISEEAAYNEQYDPGDIILQDPVGGTTTKEEVTEIKVVINSESAEQSETMYMPDILGENYETWAATLSAEYRVTVKYVSQYSDSVEEGRIIATDPVANSEIHEGDKVTLTYSKGAKVNTITMLNLLNMTQEEAERTIRGLGLAVGDVIAVDSEKATGLVVAQSIKGGDMVSPGTKVNLQISGGITETEEEEPDEPVQIQPVEPSKPEPEPEPEKPDQQDETHVILIRMPANRSRESVITVTVNGKSYFSKNVGVDENVVRVNYSGTIESATVTVDGSDYRDFTIE